MLASAADPERFYVSEVLPRKLAMYERYVQNHTVAGDLRVLYRTLLVLIAR